jgi:hypothetical protein
MSLTPYAAAVGIVLAFLILGVGPTTQALLQGGGYLHGSVYGFDMYDKLVPLEWVKVIATSADYQFAVSTGANGTYGMYLPSGTYNLTVSAPGYKPYSSSVAVADGSSSTINVYLEQSGVPVPEFPAQAIFMVMIVAVAAALLTKKATKLKRSFSA